MAHYTHECPTCDYMIVADEDLVFSCNDEWVCEECAREWIDEEGA